MQPAEPHWRFWHERRDLRLASPSRMEAWVAPRCALSPVTPACNGAVRRVPRTTPMAPGGGPS